MKRPSFANRVEKQYGVYYVGYYDIPDRDDVYVFYQPEPNVDLGHSHYMGLFFHWTGEAYVTNAISIVDAEYNAIQLKDGSFIVSRYRHDYQKGPNGEVVDGGIDYFHGASKMPTHKMKVIDGQEVFTPVREMAPDK